MPVEVAENTEPVEVAEVAEPTKDAKVSRIQNKRSYLILQAQLDQKNLSCC